MNILRKILLAICIIVFLISGGMLAKYFWDGHVVQRDFEQLRTEYTLKDLGKINSDTFGWVQIKDTKLNYPVMFTPPPKDDQYYLRRNFKKEESMAGTPFLDGNTDMKNSVNWTIYGHHMKDGTMFRTLLDYDDEGFLQKHPDFTLKTLKYGNHKYKIFAYGKTEALQKGFNVYDYTNITTEAKFNEYIAGLKKMTKVDTGIYPKWGQKIVTLSTCSYHADDGRYVIVGVEVK